MQVNKYDRLFSKTLRLGLFVLAIAILLALILVPLCVDIFVIKSPSTFLICGPITFVLFFWAGLDICGGIAFKNYELYSDGLVHNGNSMLFIRRTEPVVRRHMIYSYIIAGCEFALLILSIIFIFIMQWKVGPIFGIVESLIIGVIAYLIAQKERVDLKNKNY